jgi:hypothetical protein
MTTFRTLFALAAAIALGVLAWVWLQPRTASDCTPSDSACLRTVAEHLISESLQTGSNPFISDEIEVAGRLLATEGAIDLAAQRDRLAAIGFRPHNTPAVYDGYFDALFDPTYSFDIPAAIAAEASPDGSNLESYLVAAFRLALPDPTRRDKALALWDKHFDQLADSIRAGSTGHFVLSWLARHDPTLGGGYFRRAEAASVYVAGPGGWQVFFRTAAFHCRAGRLDEGRLFLDELTAYLSPPPIGMHLPALLDCHGEDTAVAAVDADLVENADWAAKVLHDDPEKDDFIVSTLDDLSDELRHGFADWLYHHSRGAEVAAFWTRYGAAEIARRHLPDIDWLPARLEESQSAPVPARPRFAPGEDTVEGRLVKLAARGTGDLSLTYEHDSDERIIELEWPAPEAIAAARGLIQHGDGPTRVVAFVVGLERQLGCTPSDATMQALLNDISALKNPLDEARAIIELLRFIPVPAALTPPADYDCIVQ